MKRSDHFLQEFLPLNVLSRICDSGGERPASVTFPAAVIFVDVSRYTALVEQNAHRGRAGLETISRHISASYSRCAAEVDGRGGEVLYFTGDALLAYWAGDVVGIRKAIRLAEDCARAICAGPGKDVNAQSRNDDDPAFHVGVGVGCLWAAALGRQPNWYLVAGGDAVIQAVKSQALASRGQYVLSAEARAALESAEDRISPLSGSPPSIPRRDWLIGFMPPLLRELLFESSQIATCIGGEHSKLSSRLLNRLDALTEIRPITALFARIRGLDQSSYSMSQYERICSFIEEILNARGGPYREMYFDHEGLIVFAAFGMRGSAHRDCPSRAVDAACAINRMVCGAGLSTSVGIATGDSLCSLVGGAHRYQLMLHGASVNRAARLMTAASEEILCDASTERFCRRAFAFESRNTLRLPGLSDMSPTFSPLEALTAARNSCELIGRKSELDVLRSAFEVALNGGKRLLLILGESGIGKTALIRNFVDDLRATDATVVSVATERNDRRTSLIPWRRLLANLLGLPAESEGEVILELVRARLQMHPELLDRLPLLSGVLGCEISNTENTRHMEGAHRADATMRFVGDLLCGLTVGPTALVIEDCQWLDSASLRLAEWIVASQNSLLLILCVRSEEEPEQIQILRRRADAVRRRAWEAVKDDPARFCQILFVQPLSEASVCELVARILDAAPLHQELASRICALSGGNPLFAEEIALTLKCEGLIAVRDGLWRSIQPLDDLRYFDGVERVIRERIDGINARALQILKVAAVIGRSFKLEDIDRVLGEENQSDSTISVVESLIAAHFVRAGSSPGNYSFRHDQIRDAVYGLIPESLRRRLHGQWAEWVEARQSPPTRADIPILAQAFEAAANGEKAVKYAASAATEALHVGAFQEAEAFLRVCLKYEPQYSGAGTAQRLLSVRWRRQLAEAYYGRGDICEQGVAVRRALALAGKPIPRSHIASTIRLVRAFLRLAIQQLVPRFEALALSDAQKDYELEIANCLNLAASADYFEFQFIRAMGSLVEAVTHAERTGVTREMATASAQLACGLGIVGHERISSYFMAKAERVATAIADPTVHAHVCCLEALWRVGRAQWSIADQYIQESQQQSLRAGNQILWCNTQVIRFWSQFYRADWGALEQTAQALLSCAQSSGNIQQEVWALRCKAICLLYTDRPREAAELLQLVTKPALGSVDFAAQVSSKGSLALALSRIGRHDESVSIAEETLRSLNQTVRPIAHSAMVGISGICEILLRGREAGLSHEYDQWLNWERRALGELKRYSRVFPVGLAQYGLWSGVASWLNGNRSAAIYSWRRALRTARKFSLGRDESIIAAELRRREDVV